MSLEQLSSRAIRGMYFEKMEAAAGLDWVDKIANLFGSDQASETYKFLGMPPVMREWIGGRHAKGISVNGVTIDNKSYEATMEILLKDMRRDKTGQIAARLQEFVERGQSHWASLLSTLIINAESTTCYDGQYFFDTDHSEGASGAQSNDLAITLSGLPVATHGSTTAPSVAEAAAVIGKITSAIYGFKDDQGEPLNEFAKEFLILTPIPLYDVFSAAATSQTFAGGETNSLPNRDYKVTVAANPRLTWTTKVAGWRTDGSIKPLIRQQETEIALKMKDENSEFAFDNKAIQLGIDTDRGVNYGRWQGSCLATMA